MSIWQADPKISLNFFLLLMLMPLNVFFSFQVGKACSLVLTFEMQW